MDPGETLLGAVPTSDLSWRMAGACKPHTDPCKPLIGLGNKRLCILVSEIVHPSRKHIVGVQVDFSVRFGVL